MAQEDRKTRRQPFVSAAAVARRRGCGEQNFVRSLGTGTWRYDTVLPIWQASQSARSKGRDVGAGTVVSPAAANEPRHGGCRPQRGAGRIRLSLPADEPTA